MPSISWWRSAITSIINCKRWISTAQVFLQRKSWLKKFRLSASEEERKSRHFMDIFKRVSLSRRVFFCRLSMRVGSAFQFGFFSKIDLGTSLELMLHRGQPNINLELFPPMDTRTRTRGNCLISIFFFHPADNVTHPVSNPARPRLKLTWVVLNWVLAIERRCCTNSLVINPEKTKLLVIGFPQITRSQPFFPVVKLLGKEIKPVPVAKDLGVIIDSSLSYNEHVTKTVSNCMHWLIRNNRIKHLLDRKTPLLLIN